MRSINCVVRHADEAAPRDVAMTPANPLFALATLTLAVGGCIADVCHAETGATLITLWVAPGSATPPPTRVSPAEGWPMLQKMVRAQITPVLIRVFSEDLIVLVCASPEENVSRPRPPPPHP